MLLVQNEGAILINGGFKRFQRTPVCIKLLIHAVGLRIDFQRFRVAFAANGAGLAYGVGLNFARFKVGAGNRLAR